MLYYTILYPPSQLGEALGIVMSEEAVVQAEIDAYIIERVRAALYVLKHCQSEAARIEYGILLAALAPVRLNTRDPKGMIRKVAERHGGKLPELGALPRYNKLLRKGREGKRAQAAVVHGEKAETITVANLTEMRGEVWEGSRTSSTSPAARRARSCPSDRTCAVTVARARMFSQGSKEGKAP